MRSVLGKQKHRFLLIVGFGVFLLASNAHSVDAPPSGTATTQPTQVVIPVEEPIPAPPTTSNALGRFRTKSGTVKVAEMLLNRYKESVVQIAALDNAGNVLGEAMGVAAGDSHIATPLSLILGNSIQWADKISITHHDGTQYFSNIALVNEQLNLVLLSPDNRPAKIPFVRPLDERPQVAIFTISLGKEPKIHQGKLSAVNKKAGTLSIAMEDVDESQAGTAIINSQGELIGMLLPNNHGILASTLEALTERAKKMESIPPPMLGAIMGRGVLVDTETKGAYPTISKAIAAIRSGEAPKINPKLYEPAKDRSYSPKEADRLVIKVLSGTYKENEIDLPSYVSLSGSGPKTTTIIGTNPKKDVLIIKKAKNTSVSGLRIVPASLQDSSAATVSIIESANIQMLGNIIESKGGTAISIKNTQSVSLDANAFPGAALGEAMRCMSSSVTATTNGFMGDWPRGLVADNGCILTASQNIFMKNKVGISANHKTASLAVLHNTFLDSVAGVHLGGLPKIFRLENNIFFRTAYGLNSNVTLPESALGRNSLWRGELVVGGHKISSSRILRSEPKFLAPARFDFRLRPGSPEYGSASGALKDFGAFQSEGFLGTHSTYLASALEIIMGEENLVKAWGLNR